MRVFITGGCGFIGSHLVRSLLQGSAAGSAIEVLNLDKLTYAASVQSLSDIQAHPHYRFCHGDVGDQQLVSGLLRQFRPDAVIHLAAESHVDRSIDGPAQFIDTNIVGTYRMLAASLAYWSELDSQQRQAFRWLHVSTDEVYGSLGQSGSFSESTAYDPHSPYAASKAAADHLVRAWHVTYGLPTIVTNCSNNYGPFQFPEKLIPHMILCALHHQPLPVYGDGQHVRDWLFVEDHVAGLERVLQHGVPGDTYNMGGNCQRNNLQLVQTICDHLDQLAPRTTGTYRELISFVSDRPGHDRRYAVDTTKIHRELGWTPTTNLEDGLSRTIQWYLTNQAWWQSILDGSYQLARIGQFNQSAHSRSPGSCS